MMHKEVNTIHKIGPIVQNALAVLQVFKDDFEEVLVSGVEVKWGFQLPFEFVNDGMIFHGLPRFL